jgi:hypothetical protein
VLERLTAKLEFVRDASELHSFGRHPPIVFEEVGRASEPCKPRTVLRVSNLRSGAMPRERGL